jgi:mannose-1-phosphate guanylyltransferase
MHDTMIYAVIMAGGQGTRLWPQSRYNNPKQLWEIVSGSSMLQNTVERVAPLILPQRTLIITGEHLFEQICTQLPQLPSENIIVEPMGRSTAPCVGLAALYIDDPDAYMVVLPSDHVIQQPDEFRRLLKLAVNVASEGESLVTFGIRPTGPETGFGYIHRGKCLRDEVYTVRKFTEKPDAATAQQFIDSGEYYWNSGMFIWKVSTLMTMIEHYLPNLYHGLMKIKTALGTADEQSVIEEVFEEIESVSIDYGIMERAETTYVVPGDFGWNDVGSWAAMPEVWETDQEGNTFQGAIMALDSHDTIAYNNDGLTALIGVENLIVVKAGNAVLVCAKDQAQRVRDVVTKLCENEMAEYL